MIVRIIAAFFVLLTLGCKNPSADERFYFISGSTGSGVDLFVNGNPTNGGRALTLFLVDGRNTIELHGDLSDEGYHLQVFRGKSIFDSETEKIVEKQHTSSEKKDNEIIEFKAEINERWAWQDADVIGTLSAKDEDAIYAIYDNISKLMENDSFNPHDLLSRSDVVYWSSVKESVATMEQQLKEISSKIPPRSELIFKNAARDELQWLTGKQIVMLTGNTDNILYLGPPEDNHPPESGELTWTFYYGFSEMFFAKFDGNWKLLIPNK